MPRAADPEFLPVVNRARQNMATYADTEELVRFGAYRSCFSPEVDEAIGLQPARGLPAAMKEESTSLTDGYRALSDILRTVETEN